MSATGPVSFFRYDDSSALADDGPLREAAGDVTIRLWRPGDGRGPAGFSLGTSARVYEAMHRLRIFKNRDYSALCVEAKDGTLLHASSIFPPFFRFPFMKQFDLQIGATYTLPEARGRKLAQLALVETVSRLARPGRAFWYLTEDDNLPSVRAAEAVGFRLAGRGRRVPRMGVGLLSAYRILMSENSPEKSLCR